MVEELQQRGYIFEEDEEQGQDDEWVEGKSMHVLPPCKVCDREAAGLHYGVNTCEACKSFFYRSISCWKEYKCYFSKITMKYCKFKPGKKTSCRYCRYLRCLEVGMSKFAIRTGRYTNVKKFQDTEEVMQRRAKTVQANSTALNPSHLQPGPVDSLNDPDNSEISPNWHDAGAKSVLNFSLYGAASPTPGPNSYSSRLHDTNFSFRTGTISTPELVSGSAPDCVHSSWGPSTPVTPTVHSSDRGFELSGVDPGMIGSLSEPPSEPAEVISDRTAARHYNRGHETTGALFQRWQKQGLRYRPYTTDISLTPISVSQRRHEDAWFSGDLRKVSNPSGQVASTTYVMQEQFPFWSPELGPFNSPFLTRSARQSSARKLKESYFQHQAYRIPNSTDRYSAYSDSFMYIPAVPSPLISNDNSSNERGDHFGPPQLGSFRPSFSSGMTGFITVADTKMSDSNIEVDEANHLSSSVTSPSSYPIHGRVHVDGISVRGGVDAGKKRDHDFSLQFSPPYRLLHIGKERETGVHADAFTRVLKSDKLAERDVSMPSLIHREDIALSPIDYTTKASSGNRTDIPTPSEQVRPQR